RGISVDDVEHSLSTGQCIGMALCLREPCAMEQVRNQIGDLNTGALVRLDEVQRVDNRLDRGTRHCSSTPFLKSSDHPLRSDCLRLRFVRADYLWPRKPFDRLEQRRQLRPVCAAIKPTVVLIVKRLAINRRMHDRNVMAIAISAIAAS